MRNRSIFTGLALAAALTTSSQAAIVLGDTVGIDFGATVSTDPSTTWNHIEAGTTTASTTLLASPETFSIADLSNTSNVTTGASFTLTNYTRYNAWDFGNGNTGDGGLINDATVYVDGLLSNRTNSRPTVSLEDYFELTFTGLDDTLTYDFVGGYARSGNDNFNGVWYADGVVTGGAGGTIDDTQGTKFVTDVQNVPTNDDYATFTGLTTDGSGNLTILLTGETAASNSGSNSGANQVILSAVTLTAVPEPSSAILLGAGGFLLLLRRGRRF